MSTKKKSKSTANIPRIPVTDLTYPMRDNRRSMTGGYGKPGEGSRMRVDNPLDQIKFERQQDLLKEYREMKGKKEELKLQRELAQMKQEVGSVDTTGGGLNIKGLYNFSAQDIATVSNMPEEDRKKFMETLQYINMMSSTRGAGGVQGMNPMLQFMAMGGFNRQGQGLGMKDIIELQKMWQTINMGAGRGNQELTNNLMMKLITETVPNLQNQASQNMQMAYNAQIAHLQANQADPMRDIKFMKEMGSELGWKPSDHSEAVSMKTLEMQNLWKEKEWEFRMMEHRDRRNLGIVEQILTNAKDIVKNVSRESVRNMMRQGPQTQEPTIPPPENPPQQEQFTGKAPMDANPLTPMTRTDPSTLKYYQCQGCGITLSAPAGTTRVLCPACGVVSNVTG